MNVNFASKSFQWIILLLLALTWGSSFILMKKGLLYFDSTEVAAFRVSMAMVVLLPISLANLKTLKGNFWPLLFAGLFSNVIPAFLFALAQTQIPSAVSGMLNSLTSLFTLTVGVLVFRIRTTIVQVFGVLIALAGAAGLVGFESFYTLGTHGKYALLIVLATIMYGVGVNIVKSKLHHVKPTHITSLTFLLTAPYALVYLLFFTDFRSDLAHRPESWTGVFYLCILAIVGTAVAVIIFNRLIKETTAVFASSVTYLIPIVAIGWGILDGEKIGGSEVIYMLFILAGIFLINTNGVQNIRSWLYPNNHSRSKA